MKSPILIAYIMVFCWHYKLDQSINMEETLCLDITGVQLKTATKCWMKIKCIPQNILYTIAELYHIGQDWGCI